MKNKIKIFLLTLCMTLCTVMPAMADELIQFGGQGKVDGNKITVVLTVDQGGALSGEVNLAYDAAKVTLVSADYGNAIKAIQDTAVESLDESHEGKNVIAVGFANLTGIGAGELLVAEFQLVGQIPKDGITFTATVEEWNNERHNGLDAETEYTTYDIVVTSNANEVKPAPKPQQPSNAGNAPTGDNAPIMLLTISIAAAVAVVVVLLAVRKRSAKQ